MHIAIDARTLRSTTGRVVERMLHYLQQLDTNNRYTVIVDAADPHPWRPRSENFTTITSSARSFSLSEQFAFKRQLDRIGADLVHFTMPQQPLLYRGRSVTTVFDLTLFRYREVGKPLTLSLLKQAIGWLAIRVIAAKTARIFVSSRYTAADVVTRLGAAPDKIVINSLAADIDPALPVAMNFPFKTFLLYVGHQSAYKNIRRLSEAHQQLLMRHPDLGLVLVGPFNGPARKNKEWAIKNGFRNIEFAGFINDGQRDWCFKNAVAYVFPSLMEGFGLPGLEAMGQGLPVISSNATCLPEIYGDAAVYFDPMDVGSISCAIEGVIVDPAVRQRLIRAGYTKHAAYSWRRMAETTLRVYREEGGC